MVVKGGLVQVLLWHSKVGAKRLKKGLKALDLFCGAGGASIGLWQTGGFHTIVGIDNNKNCGKRYPFDFVLGDALSPPVDLADFDFVWASPPCEGFSSASNHSKKLGKEYEDLLTPTRFMLSDHPCYCIENVPGAPMRPDLMLSGPAVGLFNIQRIRIFEFNPDWFKANFFLAPVATKVEPHKFKNGEALTVTTTMASNNMFYARKANGLPGKARNDESMRKMGIPEEFDFTTAEIGRAVPPPYSRFIGDKVLDSLGVEVIRLPEGSPSGMLDSIVDILNAQIRARVGL